MPGGNDARRRQPATPPPDIDADRALEREEPGASLPLPEEQRPLGDDTRGGGDERMRDEEGRPAVRGGKTGLAREDRR